VLFGRYDFGVLGADYEGCKIGLRSMEELDISWVLRSSVTYGYSIVSGRYGVLGARRRPEL
jgi:hypothetical protein